MKIPSFGSLNRFSISKTLPFGVIVDSGFSRDNGVSAAQLVFVIDLNYRTFLSFEDFRMIVSRF